MATMTETCEMGGKVSPQATITTSTFTSIPVLDLSLVESPATKPFFLAELRRALVIVGFFYLKNTPVSADIRKTFVQKAKDLFDLPLEKKLEIDMINSKHFLGYSRLGCERTARKTDHREMIDVCLAILSFPPPSVLVHLKQVAGLTAPLVSYTAARSRSR